MSCHSFLSLSKNIWWSRSGDYITPLNDCMYTVKIINTNDLLCKSVHCLLHYKITALTVNSDLSNKPQDKKITFFQRKYVTAFFISCAHFFSLWINCIDLMLTHDQVVFNNSSSRETNKMWCYFTDTELLILTYGQSIPLDNFEYLYKH